MKNLLTILAISLCLVLTATSGEEKANATETVDSFLLEIELLKQEIQLTQRKINILERLRSHYIKNNLTVPVTFLKMTEFSANKS